MLVGLGDPLALLAAGPDEAAIATAVIAEALRLDAERWNRRSHALAEHTAAATIRNLARAMT